MPAIIDLARFVIVTIRLLVMKAHIGGRRCLAMPCRQRPFSGRAFGDLSPESIIEAAGHGIVSGSSLMKGGGREPPHERPGKFKENSEWPILH
jgi:hypothetical protein